MCYEALMRIGYTHYYQGNYDKAITSYQKALDIAKSMSHPYKDRCLQEVYGGLLGIYSHQNKFSEALDYGYKTLMLSKDVYKKNHPNIGYAHISIGSIYCKTNEDKEALEHLKQAVDIFETLPIKDLEGLASAYGHIATYHKKQENYYIALSFIYRALEALKKSTGFHHLPAKLSLLINLGDIKGKLGYYEEGLTHFTEALESYRAINPKGPAIAGINRCIAELYKKMGKYEEALKYCREAIYASKLVQTRLINLYENPSLNHLSLWLPSHRI